MADIYLPIGETAVEKYLDTGSTSPDGRAIVAQVVSANGAGGGGDATAAKQDEQTGYLTSISNDTSGIAYTVENSIPTIVTVLGDATGNPNPNTTQWQLKQLRNEQGNQSTTLTGIGSNVSNIKDNVAGVLPFIGIDTTAIKNRLPSSLGAKAGTESISIVPATDAFTYGSGNVTASTIRVTLATDGVFASSITGFSNYRNAALSNAPVSVKGSAGTLHGWTFVNPNTSAVYIKVYDALVANVAVGTTTPVMVITVPAGTNSNPAVFFLETQQTEQRAFTTGITIAAVTGLADANTTPPSTVIYCEARFK